jgi:multicomponent Na+:H+ antiporter subunit B
MSEKEAVEHALQEPQADEDWHRPWIALGLVAAFAAALAVGFVDLPRETAALPAIARHAVQIALPQWGQQEVVNEIVYGSRGFDTFGETFLLLAAVVSVVTLSRAKEPRGQYVGEASAGATEQSEVDPREGEGGQESEARQAEEEESDESGDAEPPEAPVDADEVPVGTYAPERAVAMTVVVRVAARIAAVALAVMAVYLAAWGYSPGGGFPGGAALAGVAILLYAAFGHRAVRAAVRPSVLEPIESFGAAAIIAIGLFGLLFHGAMFANFLTLAEPGTIRAGGTNQLYSAAELIEVATGLTIAIFSLLGMRHDWAPDQGDDEDDGEDGGGGNDGGNGPDQGGDGQ